ncbi:mucin-7-like [Rhopalosiphum padi]|uniref:mucin-7-like n=1 Tax=Rhopalosiphum padi TaxID=40932 RepID=UPI00298E7896|nr:mucin-7-like [Rhopalosiphum padi]
MMSGLTFFLAVVVSLQVAQDGVHSCTLRNHKDKVACSILGAADPTLANSRHTSAPCVTPKLGLQHQGVLNKIPSISPVSFKSSQLIPAAPAVTLPPVTAPQHLTPNSGISSNDKILFDLLLQYLTKLEPPHTLPLPPLSSPVRGSMPENPPVLITPTTYPPYTPYPPTPNLQNSPVDQQQLLSLLLSVSGPGSDLINPAVPSDSLLPSLSPTPAAHITAPPPSDITVPNTKIEVTAAAVIESTTVTVPVDVPKSTSSTETTPAISEPSSTFPATDTNSIPANAAVQSTDSVSADVAAVASVDSSTVAPEASGSALEPAASPVPVSDTVPVADSVSTSTSAVESLAPLSQLPSNTTTPSIIV